MAMLIKMPQKNKYKYLIKKLDFTLIVHHIILVHSSPVFKRLLKRITSNLWRIFNMKICKKIKTIDAELAKLYLSCASAILSQGVTAIHKTNQITSKRIRLIF